MDQSWAEETLEARWCTDSETGMRYLLNLKTGQVIQVEEQNVKGS